MVGTASGTKFTARLNANPRDLRPLADRLRSDLLPPIARAWGDQLDNGKRRSSTATNDRGPSHSDWSSICPSPRLEEVAGATSARVRSRLHRPGAGGGPAKPAGTDGPAQPKQVEKIQVARRGADAGGDGLFDRDLHPCCRRSGRTPLGVDRPKKKTLQYQPMAQGLQWRLPTRMRRIAGC